MNLLKLVLKNLLYRPATNALTILGVTVSTTLVITLLILSTGINQGILQQAGQYQMIAGASGSPTQLLLSTLFHYELPAGNIPYQVYTDLTEDYRVEEAVPLALGDSYRGHRIIGTSATYLAKFDLASGSKDSWKPGITIIGSQVSLDAGLQVGDTFHGVHGITCSHDHGNEDENQDHVHDFTYQVAGILAPTGQVDDLNIYTSLESVWLSHDLDPADQASLEITAILFNPKGVVEQMELSRELDAMAEVQAIHTSIVMRQLLQTLGNSTLVATALAYTALAMAALSLAVALLASGTERRRDAALLRLLGASKATVLKVVILEAMAITSMGLLLGWLGAHGASHFLGNWITHKSGVFINAWQLAPGELPALAVIIILGLTAGLASGLSIYRTQPTSFLE